MLQTKNLGKQLGGRWVLRGMNLEVPPGTVYGLLGRNGAGKTTLMQLLMGLLRPDEGEARVLGADLAGEALGEKKRVGYVAQGELLPPWMRVRELIRFEASLRDVWEAASLEAWLQREAIPNSRKVGALSHGQRKRLEIEVALAPRPDVLILDEPFVGLDPVSRSQVLEVLLAHTAERNPAVLISSHVLADLERTCDRIGVVANGKLALQSDLDALKTETLIAFVPTAGLYTEHEVISRRRTAPGETWVVRSHSSDTEGQLRRLGAEVVRPTLEDLTTELLEGLEERR